MVQPRGRNQCQNPKQAHDDESSQDDGVPRDDSDPIKELSKLITERIEMFKGSGIPLLDFLGSGAALAVLSDIADLILAFSCNHDGCECECQAKGAKAFILLIIHLILVVLWWLVG